MPALAGPVSQARPFTPPPGPSAIYEQPKNVFRYGEQSIWSTQFLAAGQEIAGGSFPLFRTPLSRNGQGALRPLTIAETNIKLGGRVPNGVAYSVYGISAEYYNGDAGTDASGTDIDVPINAQTGAGSIQNLVNCINSGLLTWEFTQTKVDVAPLHLIGSGGGGFGAFAMDDAGAGALASSGTVQSGPGTIWTYRYHPVELPGDTTFGMLLRFGSRAEAIDTSLTLVRVTLFGFYQNVVEIS